MGPPIAHPHPLPLLPSAPSAPASHHPHPLSPSTSSHRRIPSPPPPPAPSTSSLLLSLPSASSQRPAPLGWRGAFQKGVAFGAPRPRRKPAEGRRKLAGGGSKAAAGQPAEVGGRWKVEGKVEGRGGVRGGRSRWGSRFEGSRFEVRGSLGIGVCVLARLLAPGSSFPLLRIQSTGSKAPDSWRLAPVRGAPGAGSQRSPAPGMRASSWHQCDRPPAPWHGESRAPPPAQRRLSCDTELERRKRMWLDRLRFGPTRVWRGWLKGYRKGVLHQVQKSIKNCQFAWGRLDAAVEWRRKSAIVEATVDLVIASNRLMWVWHKLNTLERENIMVFDGKETSDGHVAPGFKIDLPPGLASLNQELSWRPPGPRGLTKRHRQTAPSQTAATASPQAAATAPSQAAATALSAQATTETAPSQAAATAPPQAAAACSSTSENCREPSTGLAGRRPGPQPDPERKQPACQATATALSRLAATASVRAAQHEVPSATGAASAAAGAASAAEGAVPPSTAQGALGGAAAPASSAAAGAASTADGAAAPAAPGLSLVRTGPPLRQFSSKFPGLSKLSEVDLDPETDEEPSLPTQRRSRSRVPLRSLASSRVRSTSRGRIRPR